MARTEQARLQRQYEDLKENSFQHNDSNRYYFDSWNTKRDGTGTTYHDKDNVSFASDQTLYAIWKERKTLTRYENLNITAENVLWDKTSTNIYYSIVKVSYYEGTDYVISKETETGTVTSFAFTQNGDPYSEQSTSSRSISISYSRENLTATTDIVQYGYTPTFCIDVSYDSDEVSSIVGYVDSSNVKANKTVLDDSTDKVKVRFSCMTKQIKLIATPSKYYSFLKWSGSSVDGNTSSSVICNGATHDYPSITAYMKLNPLLENTVVSISGTHKKTYLKTTYTTHTAVGWHWVWRWLGWWWGWWFWESYTYTYTVPHTETIKTAYYTSKDVTSPYEITVPVNGKLTIKGKYGINVYGCSCSRYGGFDLNHNKELAHRYQQNLNNEDVSFEYSTYVKCGDTFEIDDTFSTTANHIAIWVESITIDETQTFQQGSVGNYYDEVKDAENIDDFKHKFDTAEKDNALTDYSVNVEQPKIGTRDKVHKPAYETDFETSDQQAIVKVQMIGGYGYGYTRQLKITDLSTYKTKKGIAKTKNVIVFNDCCTGNGGDLRNRYCYIYMPKFSKIRVNAVWHMVDTDNFSVDLYMKALYM